MSRSNTKARATARGAAQLGVVLLGLCLLSSFAAAAPNPPPKSKPAPPPPADVKDAEKTVREIYGDERARAKNPEERKALAERLLQAGIDEQSDAAGRYALLLTAKEVAVEAGDAATAFQAVDEVAEHFDVDGLDLKVDVAVSAAKTLRTAAERQDFVSRLDPLIAQAVLADRYDKAGQLGNLALAASRGAADPALTRSAAARVRHVNEVEAAAADARKAAAILAREPGDPKANLTVGRFRCLTKGDWENGLPMLARGSDATLRELAQRDLAGPASPDEQAKVGDGWWAAAEKLTGSAKLNAQLRAGKWYSDALPAMGKGLKREKVAGRLKAVERQQAPAELASTAGKGGDPPKLKRGELQKYADMKVLPRWERVRPRTTLRDRAVTDSLTLVRGDSPYLVVGILTVEPQATLTIEPGVVVLFAPNAKLSNKGTLAMTSDDDWIVLAPAERLGKWQGVYSRGMVTAQRCIVVGAGSGIMLEEAKNGLAATECVFAGNDKGVEVGNHSTAVVENCLFLRNGSGLECTMDGFVKFTRCLLAANGKAFSATYNGGCDGTQSTFLANKLALEAPPYENKKGWVRDCNILGTTRPQASGGSLFDARGNYWGKDTARLVAAARGGVVEGKVEASEPLDEAVDDALPALPECPYLGN